MSTKPTLHARKSGHLPTHAQLSYRQNGNRMSAQEQKMVARVGKKKSKHAQDRKTIFLGLTQPTPKSWIWPRNGFILPRATLSADHRSACPTKSADSGFSRRSREARRRFPPAELYIVWCFARSSNPPVFASLLLWA